MIANLRTAAEALETARLGGHLSLAEMVEAGNLIARVTARLRVLTDDQLRHDAEALYEADLAENTGAFDPREWIAQAVSCLDMLGLKYERAAADADHFAASVGHLVQAGGAS